MVPPLGPFPFCILLAKIFVPFPFAPLLLLVVGMNETDGVKLGAEEIVGNMLGWSDGEIVGDVLGRSDGDFDGMKDVVGLKLGS